MPSQFEKLAHPDNADAVTPNNSTDLTNKGILYVGTGGNISVITAGEQTVTFSNVPDGAFIPVSIARVNATGTTASNILVLY